MYSQNSNSEDVVNFIRRRKANLRKVFHSQCCLCNFSEVQEALEFHHVNPETKSFGLGGSQNQTKALNLQLEEMKKCILVCANCHRGIHQGIYKVPDDWKKFYDEEIANELLENLQKTKEHKLYYCQRCGKEIASKTAKYCVDCGHKVQQTCDRPDRESLKELIRNKPFTQIAKIYSVSDNAIRKWCDSYSLPRKKTEIDKYTEEEWKKI